MNRLQQYILRHFSFYFFSIFTPLFLIASMVILIQIASKTLIVQIDMLDLARIYLFFLPKIFYYTLPITFFISSVLTIAKLSFDYELIVLFSMGIDPKKIMYIFLKLSIILSMLLLFTSLLVIHHTGQLNGNFKNYKKKEAQFNIKATEFGQKFGKWFIFIDEKIDKYTFKNIVLFQEDAKSENFIIAKKAELVNSSGTLVLNLYDGKTFNYTKNNFEQINFKVMTINDSFINDHDSYENAKTYWIDPIVNYVKYNTNKKTAYSRMELLGFYIIISLFPILIVPLILSFGISNSRHEKSHKNTYMFFIIGIYFGLMAELTKALYLWSIPVFVLLWFPLALYIYKIKVKELY